MSDSRQNGFEKKTSLLHFATIPLCRRLIVALVRSPVLDLLTQEESTNNEQYAKAGTEAERGERAQSKRAKAKGSSENNIERKSFQEQGSQYVGRSKQVEGRLQYFLYETFWPCPGGF